MADKKTSLHPDTFKKDWDAERIRLSNEVKKAQKALWDHVHPEVENSQEVADQAFWEEKKSERKSLKGKK